MKKDQGKSPWGPLESYLSMQKPIKPLHQKSISIVIPTYNCSETIGITLEKILDQDYENYEIIIIDASSTDRTQEIVMGFNHPKTTFYTVSRYHRYKMLNKGITLAKGEYINFLFPGDFYRAKHVLNHICNTLWENQSPELIFCGTQLRLPRQMPRPLIADLSASNLKFGIQPSTLPSCWFRTETLRKIGKFNSNYPLRSPLELFCRFYFKHHGSCVKTNYILLDRDKQTLSQKIIYQRFMDTFRILYRYIGFSGTLRWFIHDKEWPKIFSCFFWKIKTAFSR